MTLLKCSGQKVGIIKERLLDCVFYGKVQNEKNELVKYIMSVKIE